MDNWISIEDRKPEYPHDGDKQLVCFDEPFFGKMNKEIECAQYDESNGEWTNELTSRPILRVTHWQPLPSPPKTNT